MLICALEQLLQLAPRFKENPQLFAHTNTEHDYLMRVSKDGTWGDEIQHVTFHQEMALDLLMDEPLVENPFPA